MKFLYKYTPHNMDYKYDIIKNSSLWFSKVEDFNDPLDSRLDYRQKYSEEEIKKYWLQFLKNKPNNPQTLDEILQKWGNNDDFIKQQNGVYSQSKAQMGVLCFSINPKNILIWSHYANSHKGIVYEFKPSLFENEELNSFFNGFPYKVEYPCDKNYELLSYTLTSEDRNKQFVKELLTKAKDWEYEEEYRMIDLTENGEKKFNKKALNSIIFGAKTDKSEIEYMINLCKENGFGHVDFKQSKFIKGRFKIELEEINNVQKPIPF